MTGEEGPGPGVPSYQYNETRWQYMGANNFGGAMTFSKSLSNTYRSKLVQVDGYAKVLHVIMMVSSSSL